MTPPPLRYGIFNMFNHFFFWKLSLLKLTIKKKAKIIDKRVAKDTAGNFIDQGTIELNVDLDGYLAMRDYREAYADDFVAQTSPKIAAAKKSPMKSRIPIKSPPSAKKETQVRRSRRVSGDAASLAPAPFFLLTTVWGSGLSLAMSGDDLDPASLPLTLVTGPMVSGTTVPGRTSQHICTSSVLYQPAWSQITCTSPVMLRYWGTGVNRLK